MSQELRDEIRDALLDACPEQGLGEALPEALMLPYFYPTTPFRNALQPDIFLIQGERGVGKTELFRLLAERDAAGLLGGAQLRASTCVGFGRQKGDHWVPSSEEIDAVFSQGNETAGRTFWLGLLGRRLVQDLGELQPDLARALQQVSPIHQWLPVVTQHVGELSNALNRLDASLHARNEWRFVLYDDLDTTATFYAGLFGPLRGLFGFWLERTRQWRRLHPKIFLRTDLFKADSLAFPDGAKFFGAHMVKLLWSPKQLYSLLLKRLLNQPERTEAFVSWLNAAAGPSLTVREDPTLGRTPIEGEQWPEALMTALVGRYMGASPRKGASVTWVPNHLADALGGYSPRSWLRMFHYAAENARSADTGALPLHPACFFRAEQRVSELRLQELADEDPWVLHLRQAFEDGEVPMSSDELEERIRRVPSGDGRERLPVGYDELSRYLLLRGLLGRRSDDRYDVPEIYRHALGLKRRGGVPRSA